MKSIDIRLKSAKTELLKSMVEKQLLTVKHDAFTFVNASSQIVQIDSENGTFYLYSFTEPIDHFGTVEDVAVWSFETERYKAVDRKNFIETPFHEKINFRLKRLCGFRKKSICKKGIS